MNLNNRPNAFNRTLRCEALEDRLNPVSIRFDYSLDTSGFFDSAERREALDRVAAVITTGMTDTLAPIAATPGNSWSARVYNSLTNSVQTINNPTVNQNELLVYIVAGGMNTGALAIASGGAYNSSGSQEWLDTLRTRGQAGVDQGTDFAPWGGLIAVNTNINWEFSSGKPTSNQYDFDSVLYHEMAHIFGFGLENPSFTRLISNGSYNGPEATTVYGGSIPLQNGDSTPDHFAQSVRFSGQEAIMVPALTVGVQKRFSALEYASLRDIGWAGAGQVATVPPVVPPPVAPVPVVPPVVSVPTVPPVTATPAISGGSPIIQTPSQATTETFLVGSGDNSTSMVSGFNGAGKQVSSAGGVGAGARVAQGDLTGDGVDDLAIATGPGVTQSVTVIDGKSGATLYSFSPYAAGFVGGVNVAIGSINGQGSRAALAVGADALGGPHLRIYNGGNPQEVLADFFPIEDTRFSGGIRVAFGDLNADGRDDLIVSAGRGGGPRISTYDGNTIGRGSLQPQHLTGDFVAFDPGLTNGAYVAAGDLNGDGYAELIAGSGEGGGPRTRVFDGKSLMRGDTTVLLADFFASDPSVNVGTGVRLASADVDGDGREDIISSFGPKSDGSIRVFLAKDLLRGLQTAATVLSNPEWATYGAFVGS